MLGNILEIYKMETIKKKLWENFFELGKEQLKSCKYDLAISSFNKSIKLKTKNKYDLYFFRGIAKYSNGINYSRFFNRNSKFLKSAKRDFTNCIRINKNFYAFLNRGETNYQLKNIEEALKDFNRALKISFLIKGEINSSDIASLYMKRCILFICKNDYIKALNDCEKVINLKPYPCDLFNALHNRIFLNIELCNYKEIKSDLKKLMSLDDIRNKCNENSFIKTQELTIHLGWINIKLGNYKEAEIYLNRIENFQEDYPMRKSFLLLLRGCARCHLGKYKLGINDLTHAKKLYSSSLTSEIPYGYCKFILINELPKEMQYFLGENLLSFLKEI